MKNTLLTPDETAALLRTTPAALKQARFRGTGPTFIKAGRRVLYARADIDAWLAAGRMTRTDRAA